MNENHTAQHDPASWVDRLRFSVSGPESGAPVLLLHGWGSHAGLMEPIANGLKDQYRVYLVDLPGHGQSPLPPEPWGVPEHALLVQAFVDTHIQAPYFLIGHSNGGRIGLYMASEPEMKPGIQAMVLISPSGMKRKRTAGYYVRKSIAQTLKTPVGWLPSAWQPEVNDWLRHTWIWKLLGSSDYRQLAGVMQETFVKTVNCYVEDRLAHIQAETMLVWGDKDEAISGDQMKRLDAGLPNSGLVTLEGAGHYGHLDQPQVFLGACRHFLSEVHAETTPL